MRITDKLIFDRATMQSGRARTSVDTAVRQISSGYRIQHPGDDPSAAGQISIHRAAGDRLGTIAQVAGHASDELVAADGALGEVNNLLTRAKELAMQMANPVWSSAQRQAAAVEFEGLRSGAIQALNARFGQRYLFAGFRDGTPPFDAAGNYQGDDGVRQVEVAPGAYEDVSLRADQVVKGVGGGIDVLGTLQDLVDAASANDPAGIRAVLSGIDQSIAQIATGRARLGAAMNTVDAAVESARLARESEVGATSKLADTDIADAASRLALAQRALDASLTASAKSFELTLLNKLR